MENPAGHHFEQVSLGSNGASWHPMPPGGMQGKHMAAPETCPAQQVADESNMRKKTNLQAYFGDNAGLGPDCCNKENMVIE